jgi:hypothetical protein
VPVPALRRDALEGTAFIRFYSVADLWRAYLAAPQLRIFSAHHCSTGIDIADPRRHPELSSL